MARGYIADPLYVTPSATDVEGEDEYGVVGLKSCRKGVAFIVLRNGGYDTGARPIFQADACDVIDAILYNPTCSLVKLLLTGSS